MSENVGIQTIENGVQSVITEKFLRGTVWSERDPRMRAVVLNLTQTLFDRVIWTDRPPLEYRDDPGIWNGIKRWLPFVRPARTAMSRDTYLHHNCPHLPTVEADKHFDWLTQEVKR